MYELVQKVYGIGLTKAMDICNSLKIPHNARIKDLPETTELDIRQYIEKQGYLIGADLKRQKRQRIKEMISIRSYRGKRLEAGLPVRQRTCSNGKTAKRRIQERILATQ
jgi:small subunit ribosomal protein S13